MGQAIGDALCLTPSQARERCLGLALEAALLDIRRLAVADEDDRRLEVRRDQPATLRR